ncbi:MAG: hypothetical protein JNK04_00655 [Myxococcales bacterium]|nr:hypothetical protein [Myxococcales bacterium]
MPLVYLPDVESLFLWGTQPAPRGLPAFAEGGAPLSANLVAPEGLSDISGLKLPLFDTMAKLAVLRQLGAPTTWEGDASLADVLAPLARAAAKAARRIAMTEPSDTGEPGGLSEPSRRKARPRPSKAPGKGR